MSGPRRLSKEGSGFEQELLRAARADRPGRQARSKLLVSLGVAAGLTSAEGAGAASGLSTVAKAWLMKSLGVAVLATATGAVAVRAVRTPAPSDLDAPSTNSAAAIHVPPPPAVPVVQVAPVAPPVEATPLPVPSPAARTRGVVPSRLAAQPPPSVRSSLGDETAALDSARSALRAGRSGEALALLDGYAQGFPSGALQPEASALRVEAALAAGDRAEAESTARALLAGRPGTPAARRVRAMLNW